MLIRASTAARILGVKESVFKSATTQTAKLSPLLKGISQLTEIKASDLEQPDSFKIKGYSAPDVIRYEYDEVIALRNELKQEGVPLKPLRAKKAKSKTLLPNSEHDVVSEFSLTKEFLESLDSPIDLKIPATQLVKLTKKVLDMGLINLDGDSCTITDSGEKYITAQGCGDLEEWGFMHD